MPSQVALCLHVLHGELSKCVLFFFWWGGEGGCAGSSMLHRLFSSCDKQGLLFILVDRLLVAVAPLVAEPGL